MTNEEYWYWICNIEGIYQQKIKPLLEVFHSPENVFRAKEKDLEECRFLTGKERWNIMKAQKELKSAEDLSKLQQEHIHFLYPEHPDYPERFRVLEDNPYALYYKGCLPDPEKYAVGMVGARACSGYGKEMAIRFSSALAASDVQIISGMATGIDAYSSQGALKAGGKTFVVLGTGLDVIYPLENINLYYEILSNGGGVLSEYPLGSPGTPWHFPHRNRLISALSDKLLIMEARNRSGTLTTAQYALAQGIDIYALPGRINDPLSEGCNKLIADGCGILLNPKDFYLDLVSNPVRCKKQTGKKVKKRGRVPDPLKIFSKPDLKDVSKEASAVYAKLTYEPQAVDELIEETGMQIEELTSALSELLIFGYADESPKDHFVRI